MYISFDLLIIFIKLKKLNEIRTICGASKHDVIRKFSILTEVAIFIDILPGYKIRLPTEVHFFYYIKLCYSLILI